MQPASYYNNRIINKKHFEKVHFKYFTFLGFFVITLYNFTKQDIREFINFKNDFNRALELLTIALFGIQATRRAVRYRWY